MTISALRISVVVTSCNGARFIEEQLKSILAQEHPPDEVILGDDASSDASLAIASRCLDGFRGHVEMLSTEAQLGLTTNLTRCLKAATGDIIVLADHDDVWLGRKLTTIASAFDDPACLVVFSDADIIDTTGRLTGRSLWNEVGFSKRERRRWSEDPLGVLTRRTIVTGSTMAFRRDLLQAALPIPPNCWHDEWLTLVSVLYGRPPVAIAVPLIRYRVHDTNAAGLPTRGLRAWVERSGWPRRDALQVWSEACKRAEGGETSNSHRLSSAISFNLARPENDAPPLKRVKRVFSLLIRGQYHRFGGGVGMVLHDLVAPALYGRSKR